MKRRTNSQRLLALCAVLGTAALLAACGSSSKKTSTASASNAAATSTTSNSSAVLTVESSQQNAITQNFNPYIQSSAATLLGATSLVYEPLLQTDCGTMYVWAAMFCKFAYCGELKFSVTWLPLELTLDTFTPVWFTSGYFLIRLNVKATSAAVIGVPFDHFTPGRIVNVIDLPPVAQLYAVARKL